MNKYELYNKHGALLCNTIGCRKHKILYKSRGGHFCKSHLKELDLIRNNIYQSKQINDYKTECYYRQMEIEFRKIMEPGHMHWQLKLESMLGFL